jgi:hybrid cluster-associated redox disulfide protein
MIDIDSIVDDIMREFPETIRVFLAFRMHCVGCPIASFHSVDDSCREHGIDADRFLTALRRQIDLRTITEVSAAPGVNRRRA